MPRQRGVDTGRGPYGREPGWYERELGWTVRGEPPELVTGTRFDALRLPADAGLPLLARTRDAGPALRAGADVWLLIAEGAAAEVPGLLRWLDWGTLADGLGLRAVGAGGRVPAPVPGAQDPGDATWVLPPRPGRDCGRDLPALGIGGDAGTPDLVRLVAAAATECHRALLRRPYGATGAGAGSGTTVAADQPLAFSYASRMLAGTRPRSFTS
ncbi:SCO3374 family protein [Streptomyces sp. Z26]|uniref:SCO3374 family protein n=1 Tax=Streptomyces TaxID=1883 RepID=UPI000EF1753D|nr:SCO3374 family protein [Streptomyces sp. Z26]RLL68276.1 hypothetical protein D7M15_17110 [Streptomyces sp. Z26]